MPNSDPHIGKTLGGYTLEAFLGRGGMGAVYLAEHISLRRKVAVKVIVPDDADDPRLRERFLREARLVASINHPHVVPVYDAGEDSEGALYLVMKYVPGGDLRTLLRRSGALPMDRTVTLVAAIASALEAGHKQGLVHRDVKPANVLLEPVGDAEPHPYLSDFGLSKLVDHTSAASSAGRMIGTLDYMSPEQIRGQDVDPRSDIYSLGCLLHECLTGTTPFSGSDVAVMLAHLDAAAPAASQVQQGLPRGVDAVVARAMAKDPADRFDTTGDMVDALRAVPSERRGHRSVRMQLAAAMALVACAAIVIGARVLTAGGHAPPLVVRASGPTGSLVYDTPQGIVRVPAAGGAPHPVIRARGASDPAVTPDGKSIAFVRSKGAVSGSGDLFVAAIGGSHPRRVTSSSTRVGGQDFGPSSVAWAHDGRRLAFGSQVQQPGLFPQQAPRLDVVSVDGSHLRSLVVGCPDSPFTRAAAKGCAARHPIHPTCTYKHGQVSSCYGDGVGDPAWSPDDRRIIFSARGPGGAGNVLWLVDVSTGKLQRIGDGLGRRVARDDPAWSPNGRLIAFDGCTTDGFCSIYTMTPAGTSLRMLRAGTSIAFGPAWSPDGRFLAFTCQFNGVNSLCVMRPDGRDRHVVVRGTRRNQPTAVDWGR